MNKTDIIIIGGGITGITTALELLGTNKKITIIDRDPIDRFGGQAKESFGGVFMVDSPHQRKMGIKDSEDLAYKDWCSYAEFPEGDELVRNWAKKYIHYSKEFLPRWLKKNDVSFFPVVHWVERGLFTPGNSVPRFHMAWGTGKGIIDGLLKNLYAHPQFKNLTCLFDHKVIDFTLKNNRVTGVIGENSKTKIPFEVLADFVVIGSGGFNGNLQKVRDNWPASFGTPPELILNGSHPTADGLIHDQVKKHGGNLTYLDNMWNYAAGVHHPRPDRELHGLSLVPPKSALWFNYKGKRIGPTPLITSFDTHYLVEKICQEDKKYSWQILNYKIAKKELAVSGSEFNPAIRDKKILKFLKTVLLGNPELVKDLSDNCIDFVVANSISELAEKMSALNFGTKIEPSTLIDEIARYDDQIERGQTYHNDDQLRRIHHVRKYKGDKVRTCKFQKINDKKAYPLIAIREFILSRKSLGGIQTDLESRVLDKSEQTIAGLYAAGEASGFGGGGVHGKRALEGTFLGGCMVSSIIASEGIKKEL